MRQATALICLVLMLSAGIAQAATQTEAFTSTSGLTIPDRTAWNAPVGEVIGTMDIDLPYYISSIRVYIDLVSTNSSDLRIWAVSAWGTQIELFFIASGGEPGTIVRGWYPTDFTPREDMTQWHGEGAAGTWTIICQDWSEGGGSSTLNSWRVEIGYDDVVENETTSLGSIKALFR